MPIAGNSLCMALLSGGFLLAASAAIAQPVGPYGPPPGGQETVIVTAPHFENDGTRLNGPLEKISLTGSVSYADLDLTTREGAQALRDRVREEARAICGQLENFYPFRQAPQTSCFKSAVQTGLVQADEAITTVRQQVRFAYGPYYNGDY